MQHAVIAAGYRTPIAKAGGQLKDVEPYELASLLIRHAVENLPLQSAEIDDVILGNVVGPGGNIARLSLLHGGIPVSVPGVTVDRQCGSGLEAVTLACHMVRSGTGEMYLAGGVESVSRAPWRVEKPRSLYGQLPQVYGRARFSPPELGDPDMGIAAENVAERYEVCREDQDLYALESHQKAVKALSEERWRDVMVPVPVTTSVKSSVQQSSAVWCSTDECPRPDTSLQKLSALPPVFKDGGTVTAGNACPVNDGAALLVVTSEQACYRLGMIPLLRFVDSVVAGVDPNYLGIGPVPAVRKLLQRNGLDMADIGLVEFNEAFASQTIACMRELNIPQEIFNVNGGALAYGHPYGASGAVLVVHLAHEMARTGVRYGLVTLGVGGGLGMAALFERWSG